MAPLIRKSTSLQSIAAGMSDGPLDVVRTVYSDAIKLSSDLQDFANINKLSEKIDQARYTATTFLMAAEVARNNN